MTARSASLPLAEPAPPPRSPGFATPWFAPIGGCLAAGVAGWAWPVYLPTSTFALAPVLAFAAGLIGARLRGPRRPKRDTAPERREAPRQAAPALDAAAPMDTPRETAAPEIAAVASIAEIARASTDLGHYHVFTDILNGQLAHVTELSDEAAKTIMANLTRVDAQISALLQFIQQSGSNAQVSKIVAQIGAQMRDCQDLLKQFVERQQILAASGQEQISRILAETRGVMDLLESVEGIARQTRMLSFNVAIEAARAGESGHGFAVIGDEIRNLSSEVSALSREVRQRLESLVRTITVDLRNDAETRENSEREAVKTIDQTLEALSDDLTTLITHQRDILAKVESENESIARPVMEAMGGIQFQDIIRQQLEQLVAMARMVDEHMQALSAMLVGESDGGEAKALSEKLDALYSAYVMEKQRATHRSARGEAVAEAAAPKIELF